MEYFNLEEMNYARDPRVRKARERGLFSQFVTITPDRRNAVVTTWDDEDVETEVRVPVSWESCDACGGTGRHVNPSIDASGLTREDFDEDPDFYDGYRSGMYDVTCYTCNGDRVLPILAPVTDAQKAAVERINEIARHSRDY